MFMMEDIGGANQKKSTEGGECGSNGTSPNTSFIAPRCLGSRELTIDENLPQLMHSVIPNSVLAAPDFILGRSTEIFTKRSVCYIVAGILLRGNPADPEVCVVQEARADCYGLWYLPAGRIEEGESILTAVRREVREETGYECEPKDLLAVETQGGGWYRFTFFCSTSGGQLKQASNADKESLGASWISISQLKTIKFRSRDVKMLILEGVGYFNCLMTAESASRRPAVLPFDRLAPGMFFRLLVVQKRNESHYEVLISKDTANIGQPSLPLVEYALNSFAAAVVSKFYRELVSDGASVLGIPTRCLAVQGLQDGTAVRGFDGLCVTLLVLVKPRMDASVTRPDRYAWQKVESTAAVRFIEQAIEQAPRFFLL